MVEVEAAPASLVRAVVTRFARELRERYGTAVVSVRLFGSFARGGAHEESDVDVAVVLERADWETRRAVIDLATDVGLPHDLRLSPTVFDRETYERWHAQERPLVMDVEREGIAL
ncbi:MAG: nucleotidyltransferase domain-containing protein [Thermoanaerobaculia bacterium]